MATATRLESTSLAPDDPRTAVAEVPEATCSTDDFVPPSEDILFEVIDNVVVECPPMGSLEIDLANFIAQELTLHVASSGLGRAFVEPLRSPGLRLPDRHRRRPRQSGG